MGGRLIGELTGSGTQSTDLFLTDAPGSVLTTFSNTQNSAAVQGNQTYGPYGTGQYSQGCMDTNKGYTGQYADPLTGFDYFNARYYDPVCGTFLSADPVEGNMQGMNPYAYVGGNPETDTDPTGEMYAPPQGAGAGDGSGGGGTQSHSSSPPSCYGWCWVQQQWNHYVAPVVNHFVAPVEHYAQQMEDQILQKVHQGLTLWHVVGVIIFGVIIYGLWRFTASSPSGWTRPSWADLTTNENVPHQRYLPGGKLVPSSQHVLSDHVQMNIIDLMKKASSPKNKSKIGTSYYTFDDAQWSVDYALSTMDSAEKTALDRLEKNPRLGGTVTLDRTADRNVGWGVKMNPDGSFTIVPQTNSFRVVIGVDPSGNPFIVTSYPTI